MKLKLFKCELCGNMVAVVEDSGVPMICCGRDMTEVKAGTVDASKEKHVPVYDLGPDTIRIRVGSEPHPMTKEHYIQWIGVETNKGFHSKQLKEGEEAEAFFRFSPGEKPETIYAYCNLHGLWMTDCMETCGSCTKDSCSVTV